MSPRLRLLLCYSLTGCLTNCEPIARRSAAAEATGEVAAGDASLRRSDTAQQLAVVQDRRIPEASGMALSRLRPDHVWMHNDSGDTARLFLVGLNGITHSVVQLDAAMPHDWEDLCSFEQDGIRWLLVGDVGDNDRRRGRRGGLPVCRLLLIQELPLPDASEQKTHRWKVHATIEFEFEDGPRDCESVGVDFRGGKILLVCKSQPLACGLYSLPLITEPGRHSARAVRIATIGVPFATAMDVSRDGRSLVIVTPFSGILIRRHAEESWSDACRRPGTHLTLPPRKQGETVCFGPDETFVLLNSEGIRQPLWRLDLPVAGTSD